MLLPMISVLALRPTQPCVGMFEVMQKVAEYDAAIARGKERKWLKNHVVPVVKTADGSLYMMDRHHSSFAVFLSPNSDKQLYYEIVEEIPEITEEFTHKCYLRKRGEAIQFNDLPRNITELEDDPYRSIARLARLAGLFVKSKQYFAEFLWADFIRHHVPTDEVNAILENYHHAGLTDRFNHLCSSPDAASLPGYLGPVEAPKVDSPVAPVDLTD